MIPQGDDPSCPNALNHSCKVTGQPAGPRAKDRVH
jgi:hypothetical protein